MKTYGLIGEKLDHSFSKKYFTEKFEVENINARYELFELPNISHFPLLVAQNDFLGLNVTIPYKKAIIPFLNELDPEAKAVGAVNTIQFKQMNGRTILKGYNTDILGFSNSFIPLLQPQHKSALILGTGGASKAVAHVLKKLNINFKFVSRKSSKEAYSYQQLTKEVFAKYRIIINCTPVGTFPNIDVAPGIPYQYLTSEYLMYDLIYNPEKTLFCKLGEERGATTKNGLDMLYTQAAAAWVIWNS